MTYFENLVIIGIVYSRPCIQWVSQFSDEDLVMSAVVVNYLPQIGNSEMLWFKSYISKEGLQFKM